MCFKWGFAIDPLEANSSCCIVPLLKSCSTQNCLLYALLTAQHRAIKNFVIKVPLFHYNTLNAYKTMFLSDHSSSLSDSNEYSTDHHSTFQLRLFYFLKSLYFKLVMYLCMLTVSTHITLFATIVGKALTTDCELMQLSLSRRLNKFPSQKLSRKVINEQKVAETFSLYRIHPNQIIIRCDKWSV